MTRTPTAEEVLDHYREFMELVAEWESAAPDDAAAELAPQIALVRFEDALKQHDESRGPVTREWFEERFGTHNVKTRAGLGIKHSGSSVPWVYFTDIEGDTRFNQPIVNPTRSKIEALVEMLGGANHGKEA